MPPTPREHIYQCSPPRGRIQLMELAEDFRERAKELEEQFSPAGRELRSG
jgi:hypothetical protein